MAETKRTARKTAEVANEEVTIIPTTIKPAEELKANMINLANSLIRRVEAKEITGSEYISKIVEIYNAVK